MTITPDKLAQARERLEQLCNELSFLENVKQRRADLRLVLDALAEAERERLRALNDAACDVCMWCGSRALADGKPSPQVNGPNEAGNYTHSGDGGRSILCVATSIHSRIRWEKLGHA